MTDQNVTIRRVACELEDDYNVDQIALAIAANDPISLPQFRSVAIAPVTTTVETNRVKAHVSGIESKIQKQHLSVSIQSALTGAVNLGNAGGEHSIERPLWLSAGMSETIVSGTSWTLKPTAARNTSGHSSSIYDFVQNEDDSLQRMIYATGCRFNWVASALEGDEAFIGFDGLSANFPESSDTAAFDVWSKDLTFFNSSGVLSLNKAGSSVTFTGGVAYDASDSFITQSMTVTYDGTSIPVGGFTADGGWQPTAKSIRNNPASTAAVYLQKVRRTGGNLRLNETGTNWKKMVNDWLNAKTRALVVVIANSTQKYTITVPKFQVVQPSSSPNGETNAWDIGWAANRNANTGDDDITIALTAV